MITCLLFYFVSGPFLLTHLLLDDLKKTASETGEARIVMVTSSAHYRKVGGISQYLVHL